MQPVKASFLHFQWETILLCAELTHIRKVLSLPLLATVPGAPDYLVGLMNLAGSSIPVLDLGLRLGMRRQVEYSVNAPLLWCDNGTDSIAIIVDEVTGILEIERTALQDKPAFAQAIPYILGAIQTPNRLSLIVDLTAVITQQQRPGQHEANYD